MELDEEFADFLEQHPACYPISNSRLFMYILNLIAESPKDYPELMYAFKPITENDMKEIVFALKSAGLVAESESVNSLIFRITDLGKEFLEKYNKMREFFE